MPSALSEIESVVADSIAWMSREGEPLPEPIKDGVVGFAAVGPERTGMVVWVLEDNPAREFYEHLGAREAAVQTINIGEQELVEVAYVW